MFQETEISGAHILTHFVNLGTESTCTPSFFSTIFEFGDRIELSALSPFDLLEDELSFKDKTQKGCLGVWMD
jgi:hypothetical protein